MVLRHVLCRVKAAGGTPRHGRHRRLIKRLSGGGMASLGRRIGTLAGRRLGGRSAPSPAVGGMPGAIGDVGEGHAAPRTRPKCHGRLVKLHGWACGLSMAAMGGALWQGRPAPSLLSADAGLA